MEFVALFVVACALGAFGIAATSFKSADEHPREIMALMLGLGIIGALLLIVMELREVVK